MIVKNISGVKRLFYLGQGTRAVTLAPNEVRNLPENPTANQWVSQYVREGLLKATSSSVSGSVTTQANKAVAVLRFTGSADTGKTVTIGGRTISIVASVTDPATQVAGSATVGTLRGNFLTYLQNYPIEGVEPNAYFSQMGGDTVLHLVAKEGGAAGNDIALSTNMDKSATGFEQGGFTPAIAKQVVNFPAEIMFDDVGSEEALLIPTDFAAVTSVTVMLKAGSTLTPVPEIEIDHIPASKLLIIEDAGVSEVIKDAPQGGGDFIVTIEGWL
jgi:hypothetical protein